MKRHFSTLLSVLLVAVMILAMVPASVFAAGESLDIIATTGTVSGETISWDSANFTWTTAKGSGTAIRTSDEDHFRAYQGSITTITAKNNKKFSEVAFTLTGTTYNTPLVNSAPSTATTSVSGSTVTFTFATPVSSFEIVAAAQWRVKKVEVAFEGESLGDNNNQGGSTPAPTPVELPDNFLLKIDGKYVTDDIYLYTSNSGSQKDELVTSADKADAATFTLVENADDTISLKVGDKFLFSDGTDVNFADTASDNTKFVIETTNDGFYIKCATAQFGGNAQYLEIYSGYITVYKLTTNTSYYTFGYEEVTLPGGGSQGGGAQGGGAQGGGAQGGGSASTGDATVAIAISAAVLSLTLAGVYFAKKRTLAD